MYNINWWFSLDFLLLLKTWFFCNQYWVFQSKIITDIYIVVLPDSTMQTPDTVERRKLAIIQEVLYGQDKVQ